MFEIVNNYNQNAVIKVIGVGGGGGNAIISMLKSQIHGADFLIANTDVQALRDVDGATTVQIGSEITKGLGAGADPEKGRQAALKPARHLKNQLRELTCSLLLPEWGRYRNWCRACNSSNCKRPWYSHCCSCYKTIRFRGSGEDVKCSRGY